MIHRYRVLTVKPPCLINGCDLAGSDIVVGKDMQTHQISAGSHATHPSLTRCKIQIRLCLLGVTGPRT